VRQLQIGRYGAGSERDRQDCTAVADDKEEGLVAGDDAGDRGVDPGCRGDAALG
jgi:hypothetical protein